MHGINWHIIKHRIRECHPPRTTKKPTFLISYIKNNFTKDKEEVRICDIIGNDN